MAGERTENRTVLRLSGRDNHDFLQNLVTNDIDRLKSGLVYAALLTPQGKYLADFFLVPDENEILIDVAAYLAPALIQRLSMYKLRADVEISETNILVARGLGTVPEGAFQDPRKAELGWRAYGAATSEPTVNWDEVRVAYCIPESGMELKSGESYPLEVGLDRLNGIDFRKGCYVGQEVTARMKHKTELKKGLRRVKVKGDADPGSEIFREGRVVGTLFTRSGDRAIAYLRFDRVGNGMTAGNAKVELDE